MDRSIGIHFLDHVTTTQRQVYRAQVAIAVVLMLLGAVLIIVGTLLSGVVLAEYWKWLLGLGGTFVASLTSLRIADIFGAKARLIALRQLKSDYERGFAPGAVISEEEARRLGDRVQRLFDKTLGI